MIDRVRSWEMLLHLIKIISSAVKQGLTLEEAHVGKLSVGSFLWTNQAG